MSHQLSVKPRRWHLQPVLRTSKPTALGMLVTFWESDYKTEEPSALDCVPALVCHLSFSSVSEDWIRTAWKATAPGLAALVAELSKKAITKQFGFQWWKSGTHIRAQEMKMQSEGEMSHSVDESRASQGERMGRQGWKGGVLVWSREQVRETVTQLWALPTVEEMFEEIREAVECHIVCSSSVLHACVSQCCPEPVVKACQAWLLRQIPSFLMNFSLQHCMQYSSEDWLQLAGSTCIQHCWAMQYSPVDHWNWVGASFCCHNEGVRVVPRY